MIREAVKTMKIGNAEEGFPLEGVSYFLSVAGL